MNAHPILAKWLSGTTCYCCYCARSVLFENDTHIVLKHGSHPSYVDRMAGTQTCRAYAALYRKADLSPDGADGGRTLRTGCGEIKKWEGRIAKSRIIAECHALRIEFSTAGAGSEIPSVVPARTPHR